MKELLTAVTVTCLLVVFANDYVSTKMEVFDEIFKTEKAE